METTTANLPETLSLIPLTQSAHAIVDTDDLELLNEHKWCMAKHRQLRYARRSAGRKSIYMHRVIMNAPAGMQIDHINGNGLDNRKANLRLCNNNQNQQNSRKRKGASSRFKGVDWHDKKWRARITLYGKRKHIGIYNDQVRATLAYDIKALELFGEFANTNFGYDSLPSCQ